MTVLIIILSIFILFVGYAAYNFRKMKNMPLPEDHKNIITLSQKNFKLINKKGLMLVDFWAPWCAPCKMVAPVLNDIAETESEKLAIGKVNVDQQQQLAQKFGIRNIPTMVLFNNGKEIKRFSGVKTKKVILKEINHIVNN